MPLDEQEAKLRRLSVRGNDRLATLNLFPGSRAYREEIVIKNGLEYRVWNPFRSKLAAAILKGLKDIPFDEGTKVLYLGASTGTTVSHISDLVGHSGVIFAVELAPRVARELLDRLSSRRNVVPVLRDARRPLSYEVVYGKADVIYCDIAQPDETEIAMENCRKYLKKDGFLFIAIKSRSIDVTMEPKKIYKQELVKLKKNGFVISEVIDLNPFSKDHIFVSAKHA